MHEISNVCACDLFEMRDDASVPLSPLRCHGQTAIAHEHRSYMRQDYCYSTIPTIQIALSAKWYGACSYPQVQSRLRHIRNLPTVARTMAAVRPRGGRGSAPLPIPDHLLHRGRPRLRANNRPSAP